MTRKDQILKMIVEYFVKTAEPVGSQTLLNEYHLDYSSATIRAEMNALEKEGLLEKTHTSSGRVPSAKGYEYYVEHLRVDSVDNSVRFALKKVLDEKSKSVEEIIKESCEILSHMTNLASVVLGPEADQECLVSVQLIPLSEKTATAVFVTDKGYVENKTFVLDEKISLEEVQKTVTLLNDRLKGSPIASLVPKMEAMKPALTDYVVQHDAVYQAILQAFLKFAGDRINSYGKENLFQTPEFAEDTKKLQRVLELVDDPEALREMITKGGGGDGVNLSIGEEGSDLDNVALLSTDVTLPGNQKTKISLLGPTRMDYAKVMGALDAVSQALGEYFSQDGEDEENPEEKKSHKKEEA